MAGTGKLRVGVLFGGRSGEHAVSIMSARSILGDMDTQHYEIVQIGIAPDGSWWTGENVLGVFLNKGDYSSLQLVTLLPDPAHARLLYGGAGEGLSRRPHVQGVRLPGWWARLKVGRGEGRWRLRASRIGAR